MDFKITNENFSSDILKKKSCLFPSNYHKYLNTMTVLFIGSSWHEWVKPKPIYAQSMCRNRKLILIKEFLGNWRGVTFKINNLQLLRLISKLMLIHLHKKVIFISCKTSKYFCLKDNLNRDRVIRMKRGKRSLLKVSLWIYAAMIYNSWM